MGAQLAAAKEAATAQAKETERLQEQTQRSKTAEQDWQRCNSKLAETEAAARKELLEVRMLSKRAKAEATASQAKLEQLQQETDELRKSLAQAEASSVEKDKQLAQAREKADHAIQRLEKHQEMAGNKSLKMRWAVCKQCVRAVDGVESRHIFE